MPSVPRAKSPEAAQRAAKAINQQLKLLESRPEIGRRLERQPELRELTIGFGAYGYVALYRYEASEEVVYLLAFRHQREAGY
ncbi:type II toxin-antitoxin system RelE/ParE family toxin [Allorhizobium sp. NPDC080224]|uniref:type II toxin-antitoxin system RelE/ParE family toxin n=1 Tax=Allorhizobium sp. NPDC080224 TaxID=3390547 RepID=UPI003D036232